MVSWLTKGVAPWNNKKRPSVKVWQTCLSRPLNKAPWWIKIKLKSMVKKRRIKLQGRPPTTPLSLKSTLQKLRTAPLLKLRMTSLLKLRMTSLLGKKPPSHLSQPRNQPPTGNKLQPHPEHPPSLRNKLQPHPKHPPRSPKMTLLQSWRRIKRKLPQGLMLMAKKGRHQHCDQTLLSDWPSKWDAPSSASRPTPRNTRSSKSISIIKLFRFPLLIFSHLYASLCTPLC